ncbi:MAG: DnaJ domain-containing protein [Oligoflexia bacterium]|nr:DnaJ domain-containing protein [Oligoflexia bacterium]
MWFLGRYIVPAIGTMFYEKFVNKKKKNNHSQFDHMIEAQKQILRQKQGLSSPSNSQSSQGKNTKAKNDDAIIKLYEKEIKKLNDSESELREGYQKVLHLFQSKQWGNFDSLQIVGSKFKKLYQFDVPSQVIDTAVRNTLDEGFLLSRRSKQLVNFEEYNEIIESYVTLHILFKEIKSKEFILTKKIATLKKLKVESIVKSIIHFLLRKPSKQQLSELIKGNLKELLTLIPEQVPLGLLKSRDNKFFLNRSELIFEFTEEAGFYQSLNPLPEINHKSDIKLAYQILGVSSNDSQDQIKKAYKRLAKERHPDTMKSKGIDSQYEALLTENFSKLQIAYDIIKKG